MDTDNTSFNPLVSIVIPVYNGANFIKDAIDSALSQTYKNIEVIVVDDGSTDYTKEIVASYGNQIKYYKKDNGGVATALNFAIKKARGKYISWLSHDDKYYPEKVKTQIDVLKTLDDKNTIIFSNYDVLNENNKTIVPSGVHFNFNNNYSSYEFEMALTFFNSKLNGCSLLIPKSIFSSIAFFDPNLRTVQDYELFVKFYLNKIKFHYIDKYLIISRHHKDQDTHKLLQIHIKELNGLYIRMTDSFSRLFGNLSFSQINIFLNMMKKRGLDYAYMHMLSLWANFNTPKDKMHIWMYWENKKGQHIPDYIRLCWKSIIIQNKGLFQIHILSDNNIQSWLPNINLKYLSLTEIAHKADYIRFNLLYEYGGIWLDSDFAAFRSLNEIIPVIKTHDFVCCAYHHKKGKLFPIIFFLGANEKNKICKNVIRDVDRILDQIDPNNASTQPAWDTIGGWILANYINDPKINTYIYDISYFLPIYSISDNTMGKVAVQNNLEENLMKINPLAFGQNLANSNIPTYLKSLSEERLLEDDVLFCKLIRYGLGLNGFKYNVKYRLPKVFNIFKYLIMYSFNEISGKRRKRAIINNMYLLSDRYIPASIRRVIKNNVPQFSKYAK